MQNKWGSMLKTNGSPMLGMGAPAMMDYNPSQSMGYDSGFLQNMDFLNGGSGYDGGGASNVMPQSNMGGWSLFDKRGADGSSSQGVMNPLINGASALMSGILGFKQLGMQKDALKQSKKEFEMNWGANQKATNSALEDRQRARVASNSTAYQSVGDYMKKNGI